MRLIVELSYAPYSLSFTLHTTINMSYLSSLNNLLTTTTSRYASLRRNILSSSSEDDTVSAVLLLSNHITMPTTLFSLPTSQFASSTPTPQAKET